MSHPLETAAKQMIMEAFEGPLYPGKESWFTETNPDSGIFGAIKEVAAQTASLSVNGSTLAAQIDHLRYHMWGTNRLLEMGAMPEMDWGASWKIKSVEPEEWDQIQTGLKEEYQELLKKIEEVEWTELNSKEVLGSLAHSAYHLGAIKQLLKAIRRRG